MYIPFTRLLTKVAMRELRRLLMVFLSLALLANAQKEPDAKVGKSFWLTDGTVSLSNWTGRHCIPTS